MLIIDQNMYNFILLQVCAPRWRNNIEKKLISNPLSWMNGICYEIPRILDATYVGQFAFLSKDHNLQTLNESGKYYYHYMHGQMGMSVQYVNEGVS